MTAPKRQKVSEEKVEPKSVAISKRQKVSEEKVEPKSVAISKRQKVSEERTACRTNTYTAPHQKGGLQASLSASPY